MKLVNTKIVFVTPYFYPHPGGLETYVYNIARGLSRDYGWDVVVITSNDDKREKRIETIDKMRVYRLPVLFRISNTPINPLWYFYIKTIIRVEKPNLVNAHGPVPFIADVAARAVGSIPFVLTYHAGTMNKHRFIPDIPIMLYEKFILPFMANKAQKIICPSQFVKNTTMASHGDKTTVIHPGVDLSLFEPSMGANRENNTVLFVCRHANMFRMKGFNYLVEAVTSLPHTSLRVIGEKINIVTTNVEFIGLKKGKALVREIQNCGVLVLPSLPDVESFGMVLLEAMACKKPVIGTQSGGIPEIITDGVDGFIVPPRNSIALENAITKVLSDRTLSRRMGEKGYEKVQRYFTWDSQVKLSNNLFLSVLQSKPKKENIVH
jgi:glycosyltransferase involved in cell wall biosynthesis